MLLHGLCGHAEEWRETASWLVASHRVLAPDARGHGRSDRFATDVSRAAHVADAEAWLEHLDLGPAVTVGQSLGGHTAFLLAALRPDLVQGLVVVEATPEPGPDAPRTVRRWLESWPVPFPSREAALAFFGGDTLWARAWVAGLDDTGDGLRPRFDIDVMIASLSETAETSYWNEWCSLECPTLIVRGENGTSREAVLRMVELQPSATLAEISGAGHDLHLEQPEKWREALETFLRNWGH